MQKRPMGGKKSQATTGTVTTAEVRSALARDTTGLAAEEEKALRMLHGVPAPRTLVLEQVGQDNPDTRDRLLGIELELLRQWRERKSAAPAPGARTTSSVTAEANPRRDKLVQALKAKKTR